MHKAQEMPSRRRSRSVTIRGQILLAFGIMSLLTACLGGWAVLSGRRAGLLVARTYDQALMSIDYAHQAAADWAAIEAAVARRRLPDRAAAATDQHVTELLQSMRDDVAVAAERAQSKHAADSAVSIDRAIASCEVVVHDLVATQSAADWRRFDHCGAAVATELDLLVNFTAGDGFRWRETALRAIRTDERLNIAGCSPGASSAPWPRRRRPRPGSPQAGSTLLSRVGPAMSSVPCSPPWR